MKLVSTPMRRLRPTASRRLTDGRCDRKLPPRAALIALTLLGAITGGALAASNNTIASSLDAVWRELLARPREIPHPPDNAPSACRTALGRALFHDRRLSRENRRSCASCHVPERAFTDGVRTATSINGGALARNTPSLLDVGWSPSLHWDGRAKTLEEQAWLPISHPEELAGQWPRIEAALETDPVTRAAFAVAFPDQPAVSASNLAKALAAYERTLVSPPTRFDRWVAGDEAALSHEERAGFRLFVGRAGCVGCHGGWRFSDGRRHDIGLPRADGDPVEPMAFRTPGLRGLTRTAPYMHDGSKATLADVIDHYSAGFVRRPSLSGNIVRDLRLTPTEKGQLIAFLTALSPDDSVGVGDSATPLPSLRQVCVPSLAPTR